MSLNISEIEDFLLFESLAKGLGSCNASVDVEVAVFLIVVEVASIGSDRPSFIILPGLMSL